MKAKINKSELAIVIILRVVGISGLFAIPAIFSFDIRRYRSFLKLWAVIVIVTGFVLLGIDIEAGMPMNWTLCEGPPTIAIGLVVLWLQQRISDQSDTGH